MAREPSEGIWQWIVKRDLSENELAKELNALERKGTEIFQVLPVPKGAGCRYLIVARRPLSRATDDEGG